MTEEADGLGCIFRWTDRVAQRDDTAPAGGVGDNRATRAEEIGFVFEQGRAGQGSAAVRRDDRGGAGALIRSGGLADQHRADQLEQGIAAGGSSHQINGKHKIPSETGDRQQAGIVKSGEHHQGLLEGAPKAEMDLEMPVEQVQPNGAVGQGKPEGPSQHDQALADGGTVRIGVVVWPQDQQEDDQ